jgi:hypothetical protein
MPSLDPVDTPLWDNGTDAVKGAVHELVGLVASTHVARRDGVIVWREKARIGKLAAADWFDRGTERRHGEQ